MGDQYMLRNIPVFYDSFEYVRLVEAMDFGRALALLRSSHQPVHAWYLLTGFVLRQITGLSAGNALLGLSLFGGAAALAAWYRIVLRLFGDRNAARWSVLFAAAAPYFALGTTNIVYEPFLIALQLWSLLAFVRGLESNNPKWLFLGGLFFGASISTFIGSLFLLPWFVGLWLWKYRWRWKAVLIFILISLAFNFGVDWLVFQSMESILQKYLSHAGDTPRLDAGTIRLIGLLVRNSIFSLGAQLSVSGLAALAIGFIRLTWLDRRRSLFLMASLGPIFLLQQYWHAGLFGRLSLIGIFPASLIIASAFRLTRSRLLILALILATTVQVLAAQTQPAPLNHLGRLYSSHNSEGKTLRITSDYSRFIFEDNASQVLVLNGFTELNTLEKQIQSAQESGWTVLIDSLALRYPYYQYDGNFLHILSTGRSGESKIKPLVARWEPVLLERDQKYPDLALYELKTKSITTAPVITKTFLSPELTHPQSIFGSDWLVLIFRRFHPRPVIWYWEY